MYQRNYHNLKVDDIDVNIYILALCHVDLIRSKELSSVSVYHAPVFAGFSDHRHGVSSFQMFLLGYIFLVMGVISYLPNSKIVFIYKK